MPYRPPEKHEDTFRDEDWCRRKNYGENLSFREMAELADVSKETIRRWFTERHGLDPRSSSEAVKLSWDGDDERRAQFSEQVEEWIGDQTADHQDEQWFKELLSSRTGEDNPNWSGGYDGNYTAHTGWRKVREKVIQRDRVCWGCGLPYRLQVHHVTPVREFEDPADAHTMDNLITVCQWCHPGFECRHTMVKV